MLYARLNDAGTAFEPQRNLMTKTFGLDGGGSVAADQEGNVYVAWHGKTVGAAKGEDGRQVWVTTSRNDGKTFAAEVPAFNKPTGACGCCGLNIFAGNNGNVYALYRAATEKVNRGIYLLVSEDRGMNFRGREIHPWKIGACPMSSMMLAAGPDGVLAAWQTKDQVYYAAVVESESTIAVSNPIAAPGEASRRKYPALAVNARGEKVFVWSDNAGWAKGGSLGWQVFNSQGKLSGGNASAPAIPKWSFGAAFARADGGFTVLY